MKSQAIVEFGAPLQEIVTETPRPGGTEVLVKVTRCGVCHSDVHIHEGYFDLGGGNKLPIGGGMRLPATLGHEIEGEVVALGPDAAGHGIGVGERRVIFPWIGCGDCPTCRRGDEHICSRPRALGVAVPGGYADYCLVPHPRYLLDCTGISDGLAATYMCSGLTAYGALRKIGEVAPDEPVLIVGAGGVGMMGLQLAKALFGKGPLVADISEKTRAAAMKAGATAVYDPNDEGALKQLQADTGGGPYAAVDFVGSESSLAFATGAVRRGGKVVVVGLFGGGFAMPIPMFPLRAITIAGSYVGSLDQCKEMLSLIKAGKVDPIPIEMRPLSDANKTLDDLKNGKIVGRVVLEP